MLVHPMQKSIEQPLERRSFENKQCAQSFNEREWKQHHSRRSIDL